MADPIAPAPHKYSINKEDIEGMMRSGAPGEKIVARLHRMDVRTEKNVLGWLIEVARPLYGEEHVHHSFVTLAAVQRGPEWVEEMHRIIDTAFEAARKEHPKARH